MIFFFGGGGAGDYQYFNKYIVTDLTNATAAGGKREHCSCACLLHAALTSSVRDLKLLQRIHSCRIQQKMPTAFSSSLHCYSHMYARAKAISCTMIGQSNQRVHNDWSLSTALSRQGNPLFLYVAFPRHLPRTVRLRWEVNALWCKLSMKNESVWWE